MLKRLSSYIARLSGSLKRYWRKSLWHKAVTVLITLVLLLTGTMYGIARWYIHAEASKPLKLGVTFVPDYAGSLGVDPQQTMDGLLGIGVRHFRLVSYWSDMEQSPGQYDFSQLDWQFKKAEAKHAKVVLALGLRQPRWPECHMPGWATDEPENQWQPRLEKFMQAVVNRYKNSPSLDKYLVENEFFLKGFGRCDEIPNSLDRSRLVSEYNLVKKTDPRHAVAVGRSNNAIGFPVGQPQPDEFSISVYKRVWDGTLTHRYLEYPFPAWFYGFLAGTQKIYSDKDMMIGELQMEAWPPHGQGITDISLAEQNKSFNAGRMKARFDYGKATGMREIYAWGAEYWYYRAQVLHDPSLWNIAKQEY